MIPTSGRQTVLTVGRYEAVVASVGATLRSLRHDGKDLIAPFPEDHLRPAMRGALLAPWPNRLADGRFEFGGEVHQLALNEPDLRTAAHGLIAWQDFTVTAQHSDRLELSTTIQPQPGYPWRVRIEAGFQLTADGLHQEVTAINESAVPAPIGLGGHPYLLAGTLAPHAIDDWLLQVPAGQVQCVSPDRMLPVSREPVATHAEGALDFRRARQLGETRINNAFTSLLRDDHGSTRVQLTQPDGTGTEIVLDDRCSWVQIYTADGESGDGARYGLAVEPMTCPADAMNSGVDLRILDPGAATSLGWVIRRISREN